MELKTLQELIDQLELVTTVQNSKFEIVMQNKKSFELFGNIIGRKCYEVFHGLNSPPKFCRILSAMEGKSEWEEFYEPKLNKWLMAKSNMIRNSETLFLHFVDDITTRKKSELKLVNLNEMLKLATRIIRHDVLNILTTVNAYIELAKEYNDKNFLEKAFDQLSNAIKLLKHTRELSIEETELRAIRVAEIVRAISKGFAVNIIVEGDCEVLADDGLISIFDNLIRNAVEHGKASQIEVKIIKLNGICEIRVADNGKGIPAEIRDKIFEKGFTTAKGHTGMGLFITKLIVQRYGGEIRVEENVPTGTVFILRLKSSGF
ncbi:MAG: HAMP domain-containing histidine kinase [Archaeoglobaceae archaeon]|nr:HAMP domain-containing histidine kinase [Archaeoglobaceae archaeon]MDW8117711.1 HAMP domain-containing sensor histidine kinase [Archaeoglobaceae archaeon]